MNRQWMLDSSSVLKNVLRKYWIGNFFIKCFNPSFNKHQKGWRNGERESENRSEGKKRTREREKKEGKKKQVDVLGTSGLGSLFWLRGKFGHQCSLWELPWKLPRGNSSPTVNKIHQAGVQVPPKYKNLWVMVPVILILGDTDVRGQPLSSPKGPPTSCQLLVCATDKQALSFPHARRSLSLLGQAGVPLCLLLEPLWFYADR